ncbi:putative protein parting dancer [Helianthus annuus]|nr:putative protein parting dancer [Helianthus annuus]KAJ0617880.1 putative protein parting dancer [Helianthus annuus]
MRIIRKLWRFFETSFYKLLVASLFYFCINVGVGGVCMMSIKWRDEQHPSFVNFISSFLSANSFRLNIVPIAPVMLILLVNFLSSVLCRGGKI